MIKKSSSSEHIYEEIKKEIMFLELFPGQSINEVETAERFNVSRTPIREAFKRLEIEGLVEIKSQHGTFVTLIDIDEIEDIMFMREVLEISVIKKIGSIPKSQEVKMEMLLYKQKDLLDSELDSLSKSRQFVELDNELHAAIFEIANKYNIWKRISSDRPHYNRLRVLTNLYSNDDLEKIYIEHLEIVRCIINNEHDKLESIYNDHIYRGINNLTEIVSKYVDYFK